MMMTRLSQAMRQSSDPRVTGRASKNAGFAFIEVAIASMVISLLVMSFIYVLQLTQKGTLSTKWRNQAMQVARDQMELIKADLMATQWDGIGVDTAPDYGYYEPVTVRMRRGNIIYIADATVRYVKLDGYDKEMDPDSGSYQEEPVFIPPYPDVNPTALPADAGFRYEDVAPSSDDEHYIVYVPTPDGVPGAAQVSDVVLIRIDVYWRETRPRKVDIKTASHRFEGYQNIYIESLVSNRKISPPAGTLKVTVQDSGTSDPVPGANVYLSQDAVVIDLLKSGADGSVTFKNVGSAPPLGLYTVYTKNNESIQYGDDLAGQTGVAVLPQIENDAGLLQVPPLTGGDLVVRVWAKKGIPGPLYPLMPIQGALVVVNDQFSEPLLTDSNGYAIFAYPNRIEPGPVQIVAKIFDPLQNFETNIPSIENGVQSGMISRTIFQFPSSNTDLDITMEDPYVKTTFTMSLLDVNGACIPLADRPFRVEVFDGDSPFVTQNIFEQFGPGCDVTLLLNTGTHLTTVTITDGDGAPKDWIAFNGSMNYFGAPGSTVAIGFGEAADLFPGQIPVAKLVGSVDGLGAFDYSEFQVGLYDTTTDVLLYSYPVDPDGNFDHDEIPAQVTGTADYDIKLILDPEYTSVTSSPPASEYPDMQFTRGQEIDLGTPSFTIYRGIGYLSGIVNNTNNNTIATGVMVMAVADPLGTDPAPPTELSHNIANVYIATTGEDGRYSIMVPTAVGGTEYDVYAYHTPRKINTNGSMSYTATIEESIMDQVVQSTHTLQAPLTANFTFTVGAGYE